MSAKKRTKPSVVSLPDDGLQVIALIVQRDATYLLLPLVLNQLQNAAEEGVLQCRVRMDHLLNELAMVSGEKLKVCPEEVGRSLVRELGKLGFASQLGKFEDDRSWERLCLEVSWREVVS